VLAAERPGRPDDRPRIAIAVPTIRNPERLGRCLDAARRVASDDGVEIELIVVLDDADPDVAIFLADCAPEAMVLSWPERRGLAASLNAAFRATSCAQVMVLQDDAVPQPGWLASLLHTAARHPRAGSVGSLVLSPDHTLQAAGWIIRGDGTTTMPWIGDPPPATTFAEVRAVDYVGSASVLVNRAAWSATGGFDEHLYPAIFVDADFCTALWNAGWLVILDPNSVVHHERYGSTTRPLREFVGERNRTRFLTKWSSFVADRPTGPLSMSEVEAAISRAARWLEDPPDVSPRSAVGPPRAAPPMTYVARERELLRAYVTELEPRVESLDQRLAETQALYEEMHQLANNRHEELTALATTLEATDSALDATRSELDATRSALDAIRSTATWRARDRLLRQPFVGRAPRALGAWRARRSVSSHLPEEVRAGRPTARSIARLSRGRRHPPRSMTVRSPNNPAITNRSDPPKSTPTGFPS
jgi:GT2 family glycosyltransferase